MKELLPLTSEELARAEGRLLYPAPESRSEAAKKHSVDLTLVLRTAAPVSLRTSKGA